jgi:hypothetical protein
VPTPSAVKCTISARHTCFCGALRSLIVNDHGNGTPDFHRIGTPLAKRTDGSARPGGAGWGCAAGAGAAG